MFRYYSHAAIAILCSSAVVRAAPPLSVKEELCAGDEQCFAEGQEESVGVPDESYLQISRRVDRRRFIGSLFSRLFGGLADGTEAGQIIQGVAQIIPEAINILTGSNILKNAEAAVAGKVGAFVEAIFDSPIVEATERTARDLLAKHIDKIKADLELLDVTAANANGRVKDLYDDVIDFVGQIQITGENIIPTAFAAIHPDSLASIEECDGSLEKMKTDLASLRDDLRSETVPLRSLAKSLSDMVSIWTEILLVEEDGCDTASGKCTIFVCWFRRALLASSSNSNSSSSSTSSSTTETAPLGTNNNNNNENENDNNDAQEQPASSDGIADAARTQCESIFTAWCKEPCATRIFQHADNQDWTVANTCANMLHAAKVLYPVVCACA